MGDILEVPSPADFHVHLRQGTMSALVTPHVALGGFKLAYVMPNTKPPITSTEQALAYKKELQAIDPQTEYMMTLYLSPELTPDEIRRAKAAGIAGVKSYPRGVTTNSDSGIESYEVYYPVFEAMQEVDMVLNLHGEIPSEARTNTCVLNAEPQFLPHLRTLHAAFPRLRIVLEHATTRAAVECVKELGDTVACTITAHHLALTVDDWAGQSWHFCKPVAKYPDDREALREENSRKLAATIDENQRLGKQIVGLREELERIHDGITALKEGDKEKVERHQAQNEWNQKVLGAIEKMQKETKVLTPETFAQLSESLAHLAAFVELEERKNGFHQTGDDDSRGVGVMRALAMRLLEVSGMEHARTEEAVHIKYEHQKPSPQPTQQQSNTQDKKVRHEIPIRREERTEETWMW
ncbi:hypothetical protein FRC09_001640 [Ceratobasidium sp. 395]|nr:hypothetical protein FRC09_001640 [Ceratobasidium sp. 395]